MSILAPPPLSLYIHLPWCVRKCPYCDFNSHTLRGALPEDAYVNALLRDLELDAPLVAGRTVETVFIGGGTPSLFRPESIARLLEGVRARVPLAPDAEITLEANPGTVERERFRGFRAAGINRLSIGVQSFDDAKLAALGRIHGRAEAIAAVNAARGAGFENLNLDLMYALPAQEAAEAVADVETALRFAPSHLSVYQLTLEPNTPFHRSPPRLPDEDAVDAMQEAIVDRLAGAGYAQYEVSAYARPGRECRHNRNYWEFGDYLGIGAGAHAKLTLAERVLRIAKTRHPDAYLRAAGREEARASVRALDADDLAFEFMLNALRLRDGVPAALFTARTGLPLARVTPILAAARERGLLEPDEERLRASALGRRFLNDLVAMFLPDGARN
ncbi:MAG TPA: radical SAM family heme chaperone HemW [Burkholderiales bacterium]